MTPSPARTPQAERRRRTRVALVEAAARGISRSGYSNLVLEDVAADAGYSRGALYHLFDGKEALALAVVQWVHEDWQAEVGSLVAAEDDPVDALLAFGRGHAVYCRRDVARVRIALEVEFAGRDHPIRHALDALAESGVERFSRLITRGRRSGRLPPGPPAQAIAAGLLGALEGLVIQLAGRAPHDVALAERLVLGLVGLSPDQAEAPS